MPSSIRSSITNAVSVLKSRITEITDNRATHYAVKLVNVRDSITAGQKGELDDILFIEKIDALLREIETMHESHFPLPEELVESIVSQQMGLYDKFSQTLSTLDPSKRLDILDSIKPILEVNLDFPEAPISNSHALHQIVDELARLPVLQRPKVCKMAKELPNAEVAAALGHLLEEVINDLIYMAYQFRYI